MTRPLSRIETLDLGSSPAVEEVEFEWPVCPEPAIQQRLTLAADNLRERQFQHVRREAHEGYGWR